MKTSQRVAKFLFDRIMALLGLLVLAIPLLIIALMVWLRMGRPVIFTQERVGLNGKIFKIHKFRTMTEEQQISHIAYPNRNHITPLGAKLRRYKFDELPELWDVLVGKMSFVGPRPDVPGYADLLKGEERMILALRPGITGPATLKYRDEERMIAEYVKKAQSEGDPRPEDEIALWYNDEVIYPDKIRINLAYCRNYSLIGDIRIIIQTVF